MAHLASNHYASELLSSQIARSELVANNGRSDCRQEASIHRYNISCEVRSVAVKWTLMGVGEDVAQRLGEMTITTAA